MGGLGVLPHEKKKSDFLIFECPKWPISTKMPAKYGIYFLFFANKGGYLPPLVLRGGGRGPDPPPWRKPCSIETALATEDAIIIQQTRDAKEMLF